MENSNLADIRKDYTLKSLELSDLHREPITQFNEWFREARESKVKEVNAFSLATVDKNGFPNNRIVLLKGIHQDKFHFYTNYDSQKGREILDNPNVSMCFFWPELERQIRIQGHCEKATPERSDLYFESRPRGSKIGAWASAQSQTLNSRSILEQKVTLLEQQFQDQVIPRPPGWGGFAIAPTKIEFWQGRPSRIHDRFRYIRNNEVKDSINEKEPQWTIDRLSP